MTSASIRPLCGRIAAHPLSLLMILHKCEKYYELADSLREILEDPNFFTLEEISGKRLKSVSNIAAEAYTLLKALGSVSPSVLGHVEDIADSYAVLNNSKPAFIIADLQSISSMVRTELESRKFLLIPSPDGKKIRQTKPFGKDVYLAFPSARVELTNAGTAFAVELYTASIFHLMRATEVAMRALCNDRGIAAVKGVPVHMMEWHDIIKALEDENSKIAQWPKALGQIKVQAQEFYNGATAQFRGLKDEWRNHVSHTRIDYSRSRAEDATHHVKRLMQTLATRISETSVTPTIWTAAELR